MKHRLPQHKSSICSTSTSAKAAQRHSLARRTSPRNQCSHQTTPEAVKYCTYGSYSIRQVAGSALQLASSPPLDSAGSASTHSGQAPRTIAAITPQVAPQDEHIESDCWTRSDSEALEAVSSPPEQASLSSLFDDIQTELRSSGSTLSHTETLPQPSADPPKVCRVPSRVLPFNIEDQPEQRVAALPQLPRSIHRRPQLFPHFSTHMHPADEWLLHPQPPSAVAARLRSGSEPQPNGDLPASSTGAQQPDDPWYHPELAADEADDSFEEDVHRGRQGDALEAGMPAEDAPWTPGRLISLLRALSASGLHATACELLEWLFETQPDLFTSLDLSRQAVLGCALPSPLIICDVCMAGRCHAHHSTQHTKFLSSSGFELSASIVPSASHCFAASTPIRCSSPSATTRLSPRLSPKSPTKVDTPSLQVAPPATSITVFCRLEAISQLRPAGNAVLGLTHTHGCVHAGDHP